LKINKRSEARCLAPIPEIKEQGAIFLPWFASTMWQFLAPIPENAAKYDRKVLGIPIGRLFSSAYPVSA
jgi:hypothetical protein